MANSFGPGDHHSIHVRHGFHGATSPYDASELRPDGPYLNYPPPQNGSNPSFNTSHTNINKDKNGDVAIGMYTSRTPSPTPSEHALLNRKGVIDWKKMKSWRFWIRREWLWYYVIIGIIIIITALISIYDRQIVNFLQPTTNKIKDLPAGWVIPIAIFFVISFPPLFGHEILAILVGVVWGLWIGFAITAAGTFVGELGNYYAFKYCCRARGEKLEKKDLQYACLARTVREGGFKIALVARYSAIPGHFTTAIFSTCGMGVLVFALAAFLSLPKQFVTVYIGVILKESGTGTESTRDRLISYSVFAITFIITCLAMWYMYKKMDEVKVDVIRDRRKARQEKLDRAQSLRGSSVFNPSSESESHLPLNPGEDNAYQLWDGHGQAAGFSGDPRFSQSLHAPAPRHADRPDVSRIPTYRTEGGGGYSATGDRYTSSSAGLQPPSSSSPQSVSPVPTPAVHRQESGDSVGWDVAGTVGGEAYRLPTIQPHTPLSGGFVTVPLSAKNPFNRNPVQQAQQTGQATSPVPPPLVPPSSQRSTNPYSPPASPSQQPVFLLPTPTAHAFPQQSQVAFGVPVTASPTTQHGPANIYSSSQSAPHSPIQTPTQHAFSVPLSTQIRTQMTSIPSPVQRAFVPYPPTGAPASPAPSSNKAGVGTHMQESSDATVYYTPAHSRYPTDNQPERLPTPGVPPPEYHP